MRSDLRPAANKLMCEIAADPWGQVSVSIYDTGRLVALAPWLDGHPERVDHLLRTQQHDGRWEGPDGYAIVPTLSATAALLAELESGDPPHGDQMARAARAGIASLHNLLRPAVAIPDTIAVELIVPHLIEQINQVGQADLPMPPGFDTRLLQDARRRLKAGLLSPRAWACLEVFGTDAVAAAHIRPVAGAVACSAAATAAWLSGPDHGNEYLPQLQARTGGPVPGVSPIGYFEAAWVLNSLAIGGLCVGTPVALLDRLESGLTADGAPAGPGLPPDGDDTGAVLAALLRHGRTPPPDSLLGFQTGDGHFACFPDERNPSVSTNAHVLEALALFPAGHGGRRVHEATDAAARWLIAAQRADGSWQDKWHCSPYYATVCCVVALVLHRDHGEPLAQAARWVVRTQRPDGGWGRWDSTVEETAYAVQTLALWQSHTGADSVEGVPASTNGPAGVTEALTAGHAFLSRIQDQHAHPPLWHGKDLYAPPRVIHAARLAALRVGSAHLIGV